MKTQRNQRTPRILRSAVLGGLLIGAVALAAAQAQISHSQATGKQFELLRMLAL